MANGKRFICISVKMEIHDENKAAALKEEYKVMRNIPLGENNLMTALNTASRELYDAVRSFRDQNQE